MIAVVILGVVALGMASVAGSLVSTGTDGRLAAQAAAAADARVSNILVWPDYDTVDSAYVATENNTPTTGWTRKTTCTHYTASNNDYKKCTVLVTGPGIAAGISRTVTLANQ
jgi:hypothetical protein